MEVFGVSPGPDSPTNSDTDDNASDGAMSLPPLDQGPRALTERNLALHTAKVRDDDVDELDVRVGRWLDGVEEARIRGDRGRQAHNHEDD
ncbi:hypothetical protein LTR97_002830 [Elasticomyces elasticus]|uniref:Uncharacterized protein n=1 Tax=Elasticomyces elasticus TaxID=574655 RepID=A0AAN7W976_9PEZI|nr:hypothetical protein LTR97_002830 [Elasticomyces elasticus]